MTTWFTSDLHLGDKRVVAYDNRPWDSIPAMDAALIDNWNSCVAHSDVVWFLGDFACAGKEKIAKYLTLLNGTIHLVLGNHDKGTKGKEWSRVSSVARQVQCTIDGVELFMTHKPQGNWPRRKEGVVHLHGHSHGMSERRLRGRYDVGCMLWGYRPVTLAEILASRDTEDS